MRIPYEKQREIIRLLSTNKLSNREIARIVHVSHNTVKLLRTKFMKSGETWESISSLPVQEFYQRLPKTTKKQLHEPRKHMPDWEYIKQELSRKNMTLELIWQEYREEFGFNGYSYSWFVKLFNQWCKVQKKSMKQFYNAGEFLFVDFCGQTIPIYDAKTNMEKFKAQIFVGVMCNSSYNVIHAVPDQKIKSWIECHIEAFKQLGGVPQYIMPDNLKAAVIKHTRSEIIIQKDFNEFAEHYNFIVYPARSREPQDKALAEKGVQIIQTQILARLRNQRFYSLTELNKELYIHNQKINEKQTKTFPMGRTQLFLQTDKVALSPLPELPFEICERKYDVRVNEFGLIEWNKHFYSVPHQYVHCLVDLKVTQHMIEITHQRQFIAQHLLNDQTGGHTISSEHMTETQRAYKELTLPYLIEWAEKTGPYTTEFVQKKISERRDFANGIRTVQRLKQWSNQSGYTSEDLESALQYAIKINALTFDRIKSIIQKKVYGNPRDTPTTKLTLHHNIRGADYFNINKLGDK